MVKGYSELCSGWHWFASGDYDRVAPGGKRLTTHGCLNYKIATIIKSWPGCATIPKLSNNSHRDCSAWKFADAVNIDVDEGPSESHESMASTATHTYYEY